MKKRSLRKECSYGSHDKMHHCIHRGGKRTHSQYSGGKQHPLPCQNGQRQSKHLLQRLWRRQFRENLLYLLCEKRAGGRSPLSHPRRYIILIKKAGILLFQGFRLFYVIDSVFFLFFVHAITSFQTINGHTLRRKFFFILCHDIAFIIAVVQI